MGLKPKFGYAMLTEQFGPQELVSHAQLAESIELDYITVSDHFHPWIDTQGQSPFVWTVLGAISQSVNTIEVGTSVTCPIIRYHPAIVAQAAATASILFGERFFLGVGTGENLNEHITGDGWPDYQTRVFMLEEAINIMRYLWEGGTQNYSGVYYTLEQAQLYTLPKIPPRILMAASGPSSAETAGIIADGMISTSPNKELVEKYLGARGNENEIYGQITVCFDEDVNKAKQAVLELWPNGGMPGQLSVDLKTPSHFESVASLLTIEQATKDIVCGADPQEYIQTIKKYLESGFNNVHIAQIGTKQEDFLKFLSEKVLPHVL